MINPGSPLTVQRKERECGVASLPLSAEVSMNRPRTSSPDGVAGIGRSTEDEPTSPRLSQGSIDGAQFMRRQTPWTNEETNTVTGRHLLGAGESCSPKTPQCVILLLLAGK